MRKWHFSINLILWIWLAFFALTIVLVTGLTQTSLAANEFNNQAKKDLDGMGEEIYESVIKTHSVAELDLTVKYAIYKHNVSVAIVDESGAQFPQFDDSEEVDDYDWIGCYDTVKLKMQSAPDDALGVMFSDKANDEIIYACAFENSYIPQVQDSYLVVRYSMELPTIITNRMRANTYLIASAVLIFAFMISAYLSWNMTKPITEISKNAKKLAKHDYSVEFSTDSYYSEIVQLSDTLNYAKEEIRKSDDLQKELIANVSHDFKTPLTMIKAYASMIQEISGEDPEKRRKHTQVIIDESDRLAGLVNDVLDISKIRSGINALDIKVFNISEYLYNILYRFDFLKETQGFDFQIEIEDDLYSSADPEKIGQVFYNLIGNAVNYTGEDKKIFISLVRDGDVIHFKVRDTGKGIAPEEIETIWDRYYRAKEMHARPVKGTGLGLSIVKTILDKHSLEFGVESVVGEGSTFWVDFICAPDEE